MENTVKKIAGYIIKAGSVIIVICFILAALLPNKPKAVDVQKTDSINRVKEEMRAGYVSRIEDLKKNFIVTKDEFKNIEFYKHKHWGSKWPQRTTLTAGVNSKGYMWLTSNYYGDDWLFHTSITIKSEDGLIYNSETVELHDTNHRTEIDNGVYENITYTNSQHILLFLSDQEDKKVLVRFNGRQYHHDITLSKPDKIALKETFELGYALSALQEL